VEQNKISQWLLNFCVRETTTDRPVARLAIDDEDVLDDGAALVWSVVGANRRRRDGSKERVTERVASHERVSEPASDVRAPRVRVRACAVPPSPGRREAIARRTPDRRNSYL
jgi:hypothetical protein